MSKKKNKKSNEIVQVLNDSAMTSLALPRDNSEVNTTLSDYINKKRILATGAYQFIYNRLDECEDKEFISYIKKRFNLTDIEYRTIVSNAKAAREAFDASIEELKERSEELTQIINDKKQDTDKRFEAFRERAHINRTIKTDGPTFGGRSNMRSLTNEYNRFHYRDEKLNRLEEEFSKLIEEKELLTETEAYIKRRNRKIEVCNEKIRKNISQQRFWLSREEVSPKRIKNLKEQMEERRRTSFNVMGEANRHGNRFIRIMNLIDENTLRIKVTGEEEFDIKIIIPDNKIDVLKRLCEMVNKKEISVTISIDDDNVTLQYDEMKLNGYAVDEKSRRKAVKEIKDNSSLSDEEKEAEINVTYKEFFHERDARMLAGKIPHRAIAYDYNPGEIGYVIIENDGDSSVRLLAAGQITWFEHMKELGVKSDSSLQIHQNNCRKNAIILAFKKMFEDGMRFFVSECIREDLGFKLKFERIYNPSISNKKNMNMWHRELADNLAHSNCADYGIIDVVINAAYTSFIGNIQYYKLLNDSCAAAMEIGRRGLYRYTNGSFYPHMAQKDIDTLCEAFKGVKDVDLCVDKDVFKNVLEDINTSMTWAELYKSIKVCFKEKSRFECRYRTPIRCATL